MAGIKDSNIYMEAPKDVQQTILYLINVFDQIFLGKVLGEEFVINSDSEDWWYSYVRIVECNDEMVQKLNERYIDLLFKSDYNDDFKHKVVARFESGE